MDSARQLQPPRPVGGPSAAAVAPAALLSATTAPTLVILGPTASGKSGLALEVVRLLRAEGQAAEIVNADSMAQYRGLDIGTAKPSLADRAEVVHHLVDNLALSEASTVAQFQRLARVAIASCHERGCLPLIVGGSALYLRAITDHFEFPAYDAERRAALEAELAAVGPGPLYERLRALDSAAAAGILPGNGRRIVRALEVIATQGSFRSRLPEPTYAWPGIVQIGLQLPRPLMDARIDARVEAMWAAGLVAEVAGLVADGLRAAPTAARAIGYRQVLDHLDGRLSAAEAKAEIKLRTRQFARKQLAWWRRDPRISWLDAAVPITAGDVLTYLGDR